jgi:uncharacterized protein
MPKQLLRAVLLALSLVLAAPAWAEPLPAEGMAAGRELVATMRMTDQFKALMPIILNNLKTALLAGRSPKFVEDYEAALPKLMAAMEERYGELNEFFAAIYAKNFTVSELRDLIAFYRTPTGEKLLQLTPTIAQQGMQVGQAFGAKIGEEVKQRMIEELRKKGHNI